MLTFVKMNGVKMQNINNVCFVLLICLLNTSVVFADANSDLLNACYKNDFQKVTEALSKGADPNFVPAKFSPLMYAVQNKNIEVIKLLLSKGAKADYSGLNGQTPLSIAQSNKLTDAIPLLLGAKEELSLAGIDITLTLDKFNLIYKEEIESCKEEDYFEKDVGEQFKVKITKCKFKASKNGPGDGIALFYNSEIYRMTRELNLKDVKLRVAAEKLEQKGKAKSEIVTFAGGFDGIWCGASIPFAKGKAVLLSQNIFYTIVSLISNGSLPRGSTTCVESIYINQNVESVVYDNENLKKNMLNKLVELRDAEERKKANNFKI